MIEKLSLWKIGVYALFTCGQILMLSALLLTSTNMVVHIIMMLLAVTFYFIVSFTNPGVYIAAPVLNLQDQIEKTKVKSFRSNRNQNEDVQKSISNNQDKFTLEKKFNKESNKENNYNQDAYEDIADLQKKYPSGEKKVKDLVSQEDKNRNQQLSVKKQPQHQKQNEDVSKKREGRTSNFFQAAKTVFENLTNIISRKDLGDPKQQQKQNQHEAKTEEKEQIDDGFKMKSRRCSMSEQQSERQKAKTKMQQFKFEHIQKQEELQRNIDVLKHNSQRKFEAPKSNLQKKLGQIKRYCRICQIYQPLRVRHCHQCEQCISTFDHHCPWMGNCIGEKNRHFFFLYLVFQTLQFLIIMVDLIRLIATNVNVNPNDSSVAILLLGVIIFFLLLSTFLGFHIYLLLNNLTTWQFLRWEKIQYLNIFDRKYLKSPFSKGYKANMKQMVSVCMDKERKMWQEQIGDDLTKFLVKKSQKDGKNQPKFQLPETDRKMFRSHCNL